MTMTHPAPTPQLVPVTLDLYRDIHKGIRAELFSLTLSAGRLDPADGRGREALVGEVDRVMDLLVAHAEHEDAAVQPVLEARLPSLAAQVAEEHASLEHRMVGLRGTASEAAAAGPDGRRLAVHQLYLDLASFTGSYLAHQDVEERVIMPALEAEVGVEAVVEVHHQILAGIPPEEMAASLAVMLPAMNIDDRAELLGGMRAEAPAEAFAGVWSLAGSVLAPGDHAALGARLGLA